MSDESKKPNANYVGWLVTGVAVGVYGGFSLFTGPEPLGLWSNPAVLGAIGGIIGLMIAHFLARRRQARAAQTLRRDGPSEQG